MGFSEQLVLFLKSGRLATGGSNTTLDDALVDWPVNIWAGVPVKILKAGVEYTRTVTSNTATQLTFPALPVGILVTAGDAYFFPLTVATFLSLLNNIFNMVNALLVTTETGGAIVTDGLVQNVYVNNAPAGVFEPLCVKLDLTTLAALESVTVRTYYRIAPLGGLILQDEVVFAGVQAIPLKSIDLEPNRYGIQVTLERTAGVARTHNWEVVHRS